MKKITWFGMLLAVALCITACGGPKEVTDLAVTVTIGGEEYSGTYDGTAVGKIPNGSGTFEYADSKISMIYEGQWENGVAVGTANMEYDGYELEYNDVLFTGLYSGEAVDAVPCGEGDFQGNYRENYLRYDGMWKESAFVEYGFMETDVYTCRRNDELLTGKFSGEVKYGVPEGKGNFTAVDSREIEHTYSGEWKNGQYNGYGVLKVNHPRGLTQKGNYVDCNFTPTPLQFFEAMGTDKAAEYIINSKSATLIEKHPDVFLNNSVDGVELEIDKNFKYSAFSKNQDEYGGTLISVRLCIGQIREEEYWGNKITFFVARDANWNYYYTHMYGHAENIYKDSWVTLTALPLDYFTYTTVSNTQIWAIACAGVSIKK